MTSPSFLRRRWPASVQAVLALVGALGLALLAPGLAQAHVTAHATGAAPGGWAEVALRVPSESETAATVKVQLSLPADRPIAEVLTAPMPGWAIRTTKAKVDPPLSTDDGSVSEVVRTVTWTAQNGSKLGPGQYADFTVSLGPLPQGVAALSLPVTQTYDDGSVVRWDQPRAAGAPEPEHPAPTLSLSPPPGAATGDDRATSAPGGVLGAISTRRLALAGAAAGALALLLAVIGLLAARRAGRRRPTRRAPADELPRQRPGGSGHQRVSTSSGGRRST